MHLDRASTSSFKIMLAGWPGGFDKSLRSDLEGFGHSVTETYSATDAVAHLIEEDIDAVVSYLSPTEACNVLEMCGSIRPRCMRVVATSWGRLLSASAADICEADHVVPVSCTAADLMPLFESKLNRPESWERE